MNLYPSVICASIFSGLMRCIVLYPMWTRLLERRLSHRKTLLLFVCAELAFDLAYEALMLPYQNIFIAFVAYYLILMPAVILLLFRGTLLTRIANYGLGMLFFFCSALPIGIIQPLLPEDIRYITTHTYEFVSDFSPGLVVVLLWLLLSTLMEFLMVQGLLRVYHVIRNRSELPRTARFMIIPTLQALPPGLLFILYNVPGGLETKSFPTYIFCWLLVCVLCDTVLFLLSQHMDRQAREEKERKLMEQRQETFYQRYQEIDALYRRERVFHHDLNNQIATVHALYRGGHRQEALSLLDELCQYVSEYRTDRST